MTMKPVIDTANLQNLTAEQALEAVAAPRKSWHSETHPRYTKRYGDVVTTTLDGTRLVANGNGRERERIADDVRRADAAAASNGAIETAAPVDEPMATPRQIAYLRSLVDRDPGEASNFGIGPVAGTGIPASLTKREASRLIGLLA